MSNEQLKKKTSRISAFGALLGFSSRKGAKIAKLAKGRKKVTVTFCQPSLSRLSQLSEKVTVTSNPDLSKPLVARR